MECEHPLSVVRGGHVRRRRLLALAGGSGGHLHSVAAVVARSWPTETLPSSRSSLPLPLPTDGGESGAQRRSVRGLEGERLARACYGFHCRPVLRDAVAALLFADHRKNEHFDAPAAAEAAPAARAPIESVLKYVEKLASKAKQAGGRGAGSGAVEKFRRVRLENNFADAHICSHTGGLALLAAASFSELCYFAPPASPSSPAPLAPAAAPASGVCMRSNGTAEELTAIAAELRKVLTYLSSEK